MSELNKAVGPVGVVTVAGLELTVTPLTMAEERALRRQLQAAAAAGAADYFTRCAKLLAAMKAQPVAYMRAVEVITTLTATGATVSEDQLAEYRDSPDGFALELYARAKRATPGLDLDGLRAVVTVVNVDDAIEQLRAVLEGAGPNAPTP